MSRFVFHPRIEGLEDRLAPATFTVTTAKNGGTGSLRAAIVSANTNPGADVIDFNITGTGVQKIKLSAALPKITDSVTIDATTQPGFTTTPVVLINGANAPGNGLVVGLGANGSVIHGLIIQRFSGNGIVLRADGNTVEGCFIGTNATGTAAPGNGVNGIAILGTASNNTIGGDGAAQNLISGNHHDGVLLQGPGVTSNTLLSNFIGTDLPGTSALPNLLDGVGITQGANTNTIGDLTVAAINFVAGNNRHGINISGVGTSNNQVVFTTIGSNFGNGVQITKGATNNTIGGAGVDQGNVISANLGNGVLITGGGTTGNTLLGNFIGTNVLGTAASPNGRNGVAITAGASSNTVGGTTPDLGNLISSNIRNGVNISGAGTTANLIAGNQIGSEITGSTALPNGRNGVQITNGAATNTIGGTNVDALNQISGNIKNGVLIKGSGATNNLIIGNNIGTDLAGTAALANGTNGVSLAKGGKGNIVGGSSAGQGNTISGNGRFGVLIQAKQNTLQGNKIGTGSNGTTVIGNASHGVFVTTKASDTLIGGVVAGAGNIIANNGGNGVLIGRDNAQGFTTPAGNGNAVVGNSIFLNTLLGIDLNDGSNRKQAAPAITSATIITAGTQIQIGVTLTSVPNTIFRIEFFASQVGDPSGSGEGETFLGSINVTTDSVGNATGTATLPYSATFGTIITATATNLTTNDTSEFSEDEIASS